MPPCSAHLNKLHSPLAPRLWRLLAAWPLLVLLAALPTSTWAQGAYPQDASLDPPGQVARLNLAEGAVSFAPADAAGFTNRNAWTPAILNRPLTRGDRLWNGPRARSELHIGSTAVRMSELTSLDFLALDDNVTQLRLAQGTIQLRVRALYEGQQLEIDTPNLAFVISQPGNYRLDVNPARDTTRVVVQSGGGVIYGDNGMALNLGSQQQGSFSGTQLTPAAPGAAVQDSFDLWAAERDRHEDQSISARYIPREIIGYQQLDSYGDWQQDPSYGAVWLPRALPRNWAPYRAGHWSWISPWGWTWVDDAPWGFAPFHYGRWAQIGPRWAWVPGQLPQRPVYAPALVAFVGGGGVNWNISIGSGGTPRPGVGWFPLAPGEAFRPPYRASPRYINRVNNNIIVNHVPDNYRYQRQPAAVTAVSRDDFVRGRVMPGNMHPLNAADLGRAPLIGDRSALPQRPELRERPRLAPAAALPPATVATQPVVRSRDERGNDRRNVPDRIDERRNGSRAMPGPTQDRSASDAEQRTRREQQQQRAAQQEQQRQAQQQQQQLQRNQQDQQRRQNEEALGQQRALRETQKQQELERQQAQQQRAAQQDQQRQAQEQQLQRSQQDQQRRQNEEALSQQRALREQAQKQQELERQQAQQQRAAQQEQQRQAQEQQLQRNQQDQQRRQNEEALGQQRALREQAQKQQEQARQQAQQQQAQQLQQAQQQRAAQQDQQRQAQEQQRLQQQEHRQQAQERPPARPAESDNGRGRRPDGDRQGNREP